jgi:ribosome-binding factor A
MKNYPRTRKLDESIKEALAQILVEEVADPRLEFVTVTGVKTSVDMRHAEVFVTTHGGEERYKAMLAGLENAKKRIRVTLGQRVRMKFLPDLHFHLDESVDEGFAVEAALKREAKVERRLEAKREALGLSEAHAAIELPEE